MARAWDGPEGERWAAHATGYERANTRQWRRFLELVPVRASDRILDVGCGNGRSACELARLATAGAATGVDLSSAMLEVARSRAAHEGLTNVRFEQADAQVHAFDPAAADLVVSVFGVMFFDDPVAAFRNLRGALAPEGRLAVLVWRELARNDWVFAVREALAAGRQLPDPPRDAPGPFSFADRDRVREVLEAAGFQDVQLQSVDEPVDLGGDLDEAYAFVRDPRGHSWAARGPRRADRGPRPRRAEGSARPARELRGSRARRVLVARHRLGLGDGALPGAVGER
jgi:SAM-dependent methyltransferase